MIELTWFIAGIIFITFVFPLIDLIMQVLTKLFEWVMNWFQLRISRMTVETAKMQKEINDIEGNHEMTNTNVVGFQYTPEEEYEEYEDE